MALDGVRVAEQRKVLVGGIFKQRIAEERAVSVDSVDLNPIEWHSAAFDRRIDCIAAIN